MIFVCVGSRDYQFDRLIKEVDKLVEEKIILDDIYAQIGTTKYIPKNIEYSRFLSAEDFIKYQKNADIIISHAGTGALVSSIKLNKKVISVPRREKYNEHTDDHQLQVSEALAKQGYLIEVLDISNLKNAYKEIIQFHPKKFQSESKIVNIINEFITECIGENYE